MPKGRPETNSFQRAMHVFSCSNGISHTVKEVQIDKKFIVAVFGNDQENQGSEEKFADRHVGGHVKLRSYRHVSSSDLSKETYPKNKMGIAFIDSCQFALKFARWKKKCTVPENALPSAINFHINFLWADKWLFYAAHPC